MIDAFLNFGLLYVHYLVLINTCPLLFTLQWSMRKFKQTLIQTFRCFWNDFPNIHSNVEIAYNYTTHYYSGYSPFFLSYSFHPVFYAGIQRCSTNLMLNILITVGDLWFVKYHNRVIFILFINSVLLFQDTILLQESSMVARTVEVDTDVKKTVLNTNKLTLTLRNSRPCSRY